jgi:6-phosphogluconolactonase (cycloisomerase 2 family)
MAVASIATFAVTGSAGSAIAETEEGGRGAHAVYILSNDSDANAVLVFERGQDGGLVAAGSVSTGGTGSGAGLGSQGAIALSRDGRWLFAVNAGSHSIAALQIQHGGRLALVDVIDSGGDTPVSLTEADGLVYVVNAGTRQNITGFTFDGAKLRSLANSTRALSSAASVGPAEVAFTPDGSALVVTEKTTSLIDGFTVERDGSPSKAVITSSTGATPFGFAFDARGQLIVSDAAIGALSSYRIDDGAHAELVTGPVDDGHAAPCWVAVTEDGRYAYAANAHDGTISSYSVASNGALTLVAGLAASPGESSTPLDLAIAGGYLYVHDAKGNAIDAFEVADDASLVSVGTFGALPPSAAGLVAR